MGANLNVRTFPADLGRETILKRWNEMVDSSLYEDGHSYSGEIGMLGRGVRRWRDQTFDSYGEAEEFLSNEHDKWDGAMAVKYKDSAGKVFWLIGGWCSS